MEWLFLIIILVFSIVIHEVAHGAMAYHFGDPTPKYAGRLTLNPIKHLDPIGSIFLPIFFILMTKLTGGGIIFGWAKPVPIDPNNFRDKKYGQAKVALAGPTANLAIALIFGLALRSLPPAVSLSSFGLLLIYIVHVNILLAVFNLLPIPPLDGSHILFTFLPLSLENLKRILTQFGIFFLLLIIFFFFDWVVLVINWIFHLITGLPSL